MIHQHFKLVDVLTAAENIILGLSGKEILDMKSVAAKINELTSRYGFDLDPNQKIYTMSVSQKQTVEIVKLLYRGVDILILDEPTAVLTPQETESCLLSFVICVKLVIPLSSSPISFMRFYPFLTVFPFCEKALILVLSRQKTPQKLLLQR